MRFILVNGRTPTPPSFCAQCCEPIRGDYLREIATRFSYCDQRCYVDHCRIPVLSLQYLALRNHARA
jgi:hypothetical protein